MLFIMLMCAVASLVIAHHSHTRSRVSDTFVLDEQTWSVIAAVEPVFPYTATLPHQPVFDGGNYFVDTAKVAERVVDEVDLALARLAAECEAERAREILIQPVVSTNTTMPAYKRLREQRKAAGLTVRGTVPLPMCGAPTKNGGTCKNRMQYDDTINGLVGCDWHTCAVTPIYTDVSV